jgi:AhpC/TSA family
MCSYRERCICEDSVSTPRWITATDTATDNERSSPRRTQLQLVELENDMALKVGDVAPDFELPAIAGDRQITMRSRDYLGRQNLVVAFHPLDWTPT